VRIWGPTTPIPAGFEKLDESGAADLALIGAQVYRAPTVTASES
jgi:hypothetical protein